MDSEEDIELTPLEYARFHHLAIDPNTCSLSLSHLQVLQDQNLKSLTNDRHLTAIDLRTYVDTIEHLEIDEGGDILLEEVLAGHPIKLESTVLYLIDQKNPKKFRVELPLLKTDHDVDVRDFATWEQPDGSLPHEPLENGTDQCLEWPNGFELLIAKVFDDLKNEKLAASKDVLFYLHTSVLDRLTEKDEMLVWDSVSSYKCNNALQPATPPLLPSGPLTEPYIPSSPVCRLPLLSDPPSLISDDIRAAENDIFVDDQLGRTISNEKSDTFLSNTIAQPQCVRPSDIFLPFMFSDINKPMHIQPRVKVEDLKVEVPLTPQNALLAESPSRYVKFSEHIEEIMLLDAYTPSPTFFDDAIMPNAIIEAAETVKRESEQEQLQEADAKSRVRVPKMDFKLPDAPWKYHQNTHNDFSATMDAKKEMLLDVKKNFGFPAPWPGAQTLNHILSWVPFPAELGILALEERYGDEHDLDSFLFDAAPVNNSSSLAWKPSGLRILNHGENDNDEEDLDFGLFMETQPLDVSFLIRKRKMQFHEERLSIARTLKAVKVKEAPLSNSMLSDHVSPESLPGTEPEYPHSRKEIEHDSLNQTSNFLIGGGSFSAGNALNNFLEIRASQKQKLIDSVYFDGRRLSGHNHGSNLSAEDGRSQNVEPTETIKTPESRPTAPIFDPIRGHRQCIISSALLKHRALIRTLQSLLPTLNLIERDFSAHNTTGWLGRGTISRSPIHSPLADEADLITSPSTAIIISTLANIRQKPLPGQKSKVTIQERIGKVSSRYENLFVLVSEGNTSAVESTDSMDDQSKAALGDFTSFCASIETYTLMYFVNGGEINLAKWIASVISQGPTMEASVIPPLLAEETLWELFLRRIGFNAFAAQVMLAELKEPHGLDFVGSPSNIGKFGLAAFVEMGFEERKVRFARLLGGTRVLDKIGGVLEKNWGV